LRLLTALKSLHLPALVTALAALTTSYCAAFDAACGLESLPQKSQICAAFDAAFVLSLELLQKPQAQHKISYIRPVAKKNPCGSYSIKNC